MALGGALRGPWRAPRDKFLLDCHSDNDHCRPSPAIPTGSARANTPMWMRIGSSCCSFVGSHCVCALNYDLCSCDLQLISMYPRSCPLAPFMGSFRLRYCGIRVAWLCIHSGLARCDVQLSLESSHQLRVRIHIGHRPFRKTAFRVSLARTTLVTPTAVDMVLPVGHVIVMCRQVQPC